MYTIQHAVYCLLSEQFIVLPNLTAATYK